MPSENMSDIPKKVTKFVLGEEKSGTQGKIMESVCLKITFVGADHENLCYIMLKINFPVSEGFFENENNSMKRQLKIQIFHSFKIFSTLK